MVTCCQTNRALLLKIGLSVFYVAFWLFWLFWFAFLCFVFLPKSCTIHLFDKDYSVDRIEMKKTEIEDIYVY